MSMDGVAECKFEEMSTYERCEIYPFLEDLRGNDWLTEIPSGWWDLVEEGCRNILAILKAHDHKDFEFETLQMKEKYGELRWYFTAPDDCMEELNQMIDDLTARSKITCNRCGRKAELNTTDYILPWCKSCFCIYETRQRLAGRPVYNFKINGEEYIGLKVPDKEPIDHTVKQQSN